jgi:hypothetical protein
MHTMKHRFIQSFSIIGVLGLLVVLAIPNVSQAILIAPGFDFLETVTGTTFDPDGPMGPIAPIPFRGVPLPGLGNVDTIIQRQGTADTVALNTIPIEMVALQLISATAFDPDGAGPAPTAIYCATLQSTRGGPASTGTMTIGPTTFTSTINVLFDLRQAACNGAIVASGSDTIRSDTDGNPLTLDPIPWCSAGGKPFIPGCGQPFDELGLLARHRSKVPEPSGLLLLGSGLLALAVVGRKTLFKKM